MLSEKKATLTQHIHEMNSTDRDIAERSLFVHTAMERFNGMKSKHCQAAS